MKILFLGIEPSHELERVLLSNRFEIHTGKKVPKATEFDLVASLPKSPDDRDSLTALRKLYPHAWIVEVVKEAWLKNANQLSELLRGAEHNEIWIESHWEHQIWFTIQKVVQHQAQLVEADGLRKELRELKKKCDDVTQQSTQLVHKLEKDIELATSIQRNLLPKFSPEIPGVSIAVKYIPAAGLGGDYYDVFEFGDRKRFGVLLADAKTHGIAANLLSVLVKVRLEEMKERFPDSKSFVDFLNREFQQLHEKQLASLSLLYGILDRSSLTFQYTVAGHLRPILFRNGEVADLSIAVNPSLGGVDQYTFQENFIRLQPGDLLILHTDGLHAPLKGDAPKKITEILKNSENPDVREVQNNIIGLIDAHVDKEPLKDDLTVIHLGIDERALFLAPKLTKVTS